MITGSKKKPQFDSKEVQKYWNQKVVEIQSKIEKLTNAYSI
jgi:hypothetical protein